MCDENLSREELMEELVYGKTIWCKYCLWGHNCVGSEVCEDFDLLEDEDYDAFVEAIQSCRDKKMVRKMLKFLLNCR